jgi:mevalonate kinase
MVPLASFGPGKVILLGEHSVVYGYPALAAPLSWGVTARGTPSRNARLELSDQIRGAGRVLLRAAFARAAALCGQPKIKVRFESDLPTSMGLGSSAALSVACARLLLKAAGRPGKIAEVLAAAGAMERVFHGNPSGIDHTSSAQERMILFRRGMGRSAAQVRAVRCPKPLKILVVVVGNRPPTKATVSALAERTKRWPSRYHRLFKEIGHLATEGARAVENADLDTLGDLMSVNQGLLTSLQLSSTNIHEMVQRLLKMGALGAKLTGAGGEGGAVIALFREPEPAVAQLSRQGFQCFANQIAGPRAL